MISFILLTFSDLVFHTCLFSRPSQFFSLLYTLLTPILAQVTYFSHMDKYYSILPSLPASAHTRPQHSASTRLPECPSDCKLEHGTSLAKTLPQHSSLLDFDAPGDLALAPLSNLMSFLPPLTHPVSATLSFFSFHDCAKPVFTSGPHTVLLTRIACLPPAIHKPGSFHSSDVNSLQGNFCSSSC